MCHVLRVQWTIVPRIAPQPWLTCTRCGEARRFRSSGKIRLNANGKRLDAWLIYRCTVCDGTWNRPIVERRPVRQIDPQLLRSLQASDPALARRLAFDVAELRRRARRVEEFADALVSKAVLSQGIAPIRRLEILWSVPQAIGLRADRLLGSELRLSRSCLQRLEETGDLVVLPHGSRLRRPVRDGMQILIDLPSTGAIGGRRSSLDLFTDACNGQDADAPGPPEGTLP